MKNYTLVQEKYIDEIKSNVKIYQHNKSKARVCTMENDDTNKVFSIAFRTPAINNTGLTHILEHSVLCGSKKYPVKDPFVELLKSSLNTFLNAFTFPDKTMYPCASQNDKDFKNLMSVYMDAVFYPQIYSHEEIFMQEGWHYHILDENEPITYNGVVYNEMKGAFSDPEQVLFRNVTHTMYPDMAYGFESGGDPKYIPDLSYEQFKEFHSKFYHPTNSYIMIYGDCDMEERLEWLDKEYLSSFNEISFDTTVKYQPMFKAPIYKRDYYAVDKDDTLEDKTYLTYNVSLPSTLDIKLLFAISMINIALFDNPGAPVKEALIKANLGHDVQTMLDDSLLQPLLSIMIVNSNSDKEEEFINIVNNELAKIVKNGIDKEAFKSILSFAEFKARERMFSSRMPQGLEIQMNALSSWLYDDNHPFDKLETLGIIEELKNDIDNGYFEAVIGKYILNNNHKAYVRLEPSYTCADESKAELEKKLSEYKNSLSHDELVKLIEKNKRLAEYQSEESTPEEINTLPKLAVSDLTIEPEEYNLEVIANDYKTLFSDYNVNGITYNTAYFEITGISFDDYKNVLLYNDLLTYMDTNKTKYSDISKKILELTGGMRFSSDVLYDVNKKCRTFIKYSFSALEKNVKPSLDLLSEISFNTKLDDTNRLYERLCELKTNIEMSISYRANVVALTRAFSYTDELANLTDTVSYLDYITELVNDFDNKKSLLVNELNKVKNMYFGRDNFTLGFTGTKNQLESLKNVYDEFYNKLGTSNYNKKKFVPNVLNEGLKSQYDVNYVARAGHYSEEFNGSMLVLKNAISLDYLWMQVRVHGGAYGCHIQILPDGRLGFTSYRDPNIDRTMGVYENVVDYIKNLNPDDETLLKYKIGAFSSICSVMHDSEKANTARNRYFVGSTKEDRIKLRRELVNTTKQDLNNLATVFESVLKENCLCVLGNANKIEESKINFLNKRNLVK